MLNKSIIFLRQLPKRINGINELVNDPILSKTYCQNMPQKSKYKIYLELFNWLIKYQEVNKFYRSYGLDCINENVNNYISCGEFQKKRDIAQKSRFLSVGDTPYRCLLGDKFLFGKYLESLKIPTPRIVAVGYFDSITLCEDNSTIGIKDILSCEFDGFVKPLHGYGGRKIIQLKIENGKALSGEIELSFDELIKKLPEVFMIQERFTQHEVLNMLYHYCPVNS